MTRRKPNHPQELPIYPGFGGLGYWHLLPDSTTLAGLNPTQRADWLYDRVRVGWDKVADKKLTRQILKAMALELVAYFGNLGTSMPESLLRVLAVMLDLPPTFLADPVPVLTGKLAQGKSRRPEAESRRHRHRHKALH
jgi:hypothetical protein